jgi:hypothetical protein
MEFDIVPASLVVKAMQDSGYKNAAYAIAELIDNSIQAGAKRVELLCVEKRNFVQQRNRTRLSTLAVLDNGCGMNEAELRRALQFGNGGHLGDRDGIGRFGMGLPNSSMSQGSRVEVWSWQSGPQNALYSYLDLNEISSGEMREVPKPVVKAIPKVWSKIGGQFGHSGTLVVWARPDRCTWKTANAIVRNSEEIVGRMYRKFLSDDRVEIRLASFADDALDQPLIDKSALPNDPNYLMANTSCPDPWNNVPMFESWGDSRDIVINMNGKDHKVRISYSYAKKEARQGHNPGERNYGRHAARNLGVSIMRADRELELDSKWMPSYDPVARWIGIEVDFPPALDEVFGVTNNKQSATHLADLAGVDKSELAEKHGYQTYQQLKSAWEEEDDVRHPLLTVKDAIEGSISALMRALKAQTRGERGAKRHRDANSPEAKATEATKKRKEEGHAGASDAGELLDGATQIKQVEDSLRADGITEDVAHELATNTVDSGIKYVIVEANSNSGAFFNVRPGGGRLMITLNTNHPAYDNLVELLDDVTDNQTEQQLRDRLERARDGLKLVLTAWARYEDELPDGVKRTAAQDAREDWGRVARDFLRNG